MMGMYVWSLRGSSTLDTLSGVGADLRDDTWHHIVTVNTPTSINVYVDGRLVYTKTGTWTATTNNEAVLIGTREETLNQFTGYLDEVKIYNVALTADQVKIDYNGGVTQNFGANIDQATLLNDGAGNPPVKVLPKVKTTNRQN